jgi:outer membrane protein assembly factor BamB
LVSFDFEGKKIWEKPLGPFPNDWGSASSPVLYNQMLLLNCDTDAEDFLLAVDKNTGKTIWQTTRSKVTRAWPTPMIWNAEGRDQIVVSGSGRVKAYDPRDGRELWMVDGLTTWVTPTPVAAHNLLYVASNGPGGNIIMAIRPGGRGDITGSHVAWRFERSAPYSSSPVIVGDYLYAVKNGGVMTCLNARTGALAWQERLPARGDYFASLIAADGKVYALSENGEATVVAAKPVYELLSSNKMEERCMASPAVSDGQIFIRSDDNLFCIGEARR